jgi:hypothetical protein
MRRAVGHYALLLTAAATVCLGACDQRDRHPPPSPAALPSPLASDASLSVAPLGLPSPSTPPAVASSVAPDPSVLLQTRDVPTAVGPDFYARARLLWNAIVEDEPSLAMPFFFPLGAYEKVKDIPYPAADWKHRLVAAYERDIHDLHARLGNSADAVKFVALEVPDSRTRWVNPGEEYNKVGYYRVFGSKLRYETSAGARTFDVKSLISWRGTWYVVHLGAIK